jgi:hypothetical protein
VTRYVRKSLSATISRIKYEKYWPSAINTLLDNNFDLASTDKDSGFIRTTENVGVVVLNGDWGCKVQVSVKFSYQPADPKANPPASSMVQKLRIQAARHSCRNEER